MYKNVLNVLYKGVYLKGFQVILKNLLIYFF